MSVTLDDVKRVARLARLEFTAEEEQRLIGELNRILQYMESLRGVDTGQVEPTSHVVPMASPFRPDEAEAFGALEELLSQGPDMKEGYFRVPRIIE
ncbi:MAG: Asp-tRNA(Asn)/Glu-tRNA(Gln) amidotransferase subunit GatC [Gemmatimonadota bacterium]